MPSRYETLAGWANEFGWTKGVELGVFDGTTFFYLLDNCPQLSMIGIDLWGDAVRNAAPTASNEKCHCQYCEATRAKRWATPKDQIDQIEAAVRYRAGDQQRAWIIKGDTAESADLVDKVDFVFVDADHSTNGVILDIEAWAGKIKPGGRLVGHDYNFKSVREAVLSLFLPDEIKTEDDHIYWVQM